jgi:hypothetical protein
MRAFAKWLFAIVMVLSSNAGAWAMLPPSGAAIQVHYKSACANWRRECARFWGRDIQHWFDCLNQSQALADSDRDGE